MAEAAHVPECQRVPARWRPTTQGVSYTYTGEDITDVEGGRVASVFAINVM